MRFLCPLPTYCSRSLHMTRAALHCASMLVGRVHEDSKLADTAGHVKVNHKGESSMS